MTWFLKIVFTHSIDLWTLANDSRKFVSGYNLWHRILKMRIVSSVIISKPTWQSGSQTTSLIVLRSVILIIPLNDIGTFGNLTSSFFINCNWRFEFCCFLTTLFTLAMFSMIFLFCFFVTTIWWFWRWTNLATNVRSFSILIALAMLLLMSLSFCMRMRSILIRPRSQRVPRRIGHDRHLRSFHLEVFQLASLPPCENSIASISIAILTEAIIILILSIDSICIIVIMMVALYITHYFLIFRVDVEVIVVEISLSIQLALLVILAFFNVL